MRTSIFFGLIVIAKAIEFETTKGMSGLLAAFTVVMIIMDVTEFVIKINKD